MAVPTSLPGYTQDIWSQLIKVHSSEGRGGWTKLQGAILLAWTRLVWMLQKLKYSRISDDEMSINSKTRAGGVLDALSKLHVDKCVAHVSVSRLPPGSSPHTIFASPNLPVHLSLPRRHGLTSHASTHWCRHSSSDGLRKHFQSNFNKLLERTRSPGRLSKSGEVDSIKDEVDVTCGVVGIP